MNAFIFLLITAILNSDVKCKQLSPVILVPGDGGVQMKAKLNKPSDIQFNICMQKTKDYYVIWLRFLSVVIPWATHCFVENFKLIYNKETHTTSSPPGVDIKITKFGDTDTVEWLNNIHLPVLGYYDALVKNMVKWGYVRNKTVRGAPYDFRKAPNELGEYYKNLTKLIEDTYTTNNNTRVVILCHSLGNLVILYYLNQQPQAWKDKFIASFVSLAGPWGGSTKTLRMLASGDDVSIMTVNAITARPVQRSMPSSMFLMPSNQFWNKSEVLVQTPKRNYTVNDYQQFFEDLNFTDGYLMRRDTESLVNPLQPPNVAMHCIYSYGLHTAKSWVYKTGQWPDTQPKAVYDDGDHTVTIRSLEGCLPWKKLQKEPLYPKRFKGIIHMGMIKSQAIIDYIKSILMN